jgi:glycosyltransferase involved in cell wall biosynthesis
MKTILHLITGLEKGGGAEAMLLKTVPYLQESKQAVAVLKGKWEIGEKLQRKGVQVYYLNMKNYLDFTVIFKYRKILREYKPDVQINYLIHADIFGRLFAKSLGVKKLVSYIRNRHSNFPYAFLDKITLSKVDFLLTNSQANLKYYRKEYNFPIEKSDCIVNGVEINEDNNNEELKHRLNKLRQDLGVDGSDFVISSVARLHKQKSLDTLIQALKLLKDRNYKFKVIICGKGREESNLKLLVDKLGLNKQVVFLKNRDDVSDILRLSRVFVLPSIKEGMSNALLEAMSLSLPAVVSDIEENKELVNDRENGCVFRLRDCNDLAKKLIYIKEHKEDRDMMGINNKEKIKNNYDIRAVRSKLDKFLYNL